MNNQSPLDRINLACDEYEDLWIAGKKPAIGSFLQGWQGDQRRQLFTYLLELDVEYRRKAGESPQMSDYETEFPRYHTEIQQVFDNTQERADATQPDVRPPAGNKETLANKPPRREKVELPKEFGKYQILRKLGQGGMGAVYLAHDTKLDRKVAIKVPFLREEDATGVARFKRETRLLAAMRHPNICPVYEAGEVNGQHFMAMAYIDGRAMNEYLADRRPLPPGAVAAVMFKLAGAIEEAHAAGVVHRDLKPANIMIDGRNEPLVMDFGLARSGVEQSTQLTAPGALIGSPAYMSPEQVEGDIEAIGEASDVYALGVVMYQMLTGHPPFQGPLAKLLVMILSEDPPKPRSINPEIHPAMEGICVRAMAKDPANRMSAADLKEAIRAHIQDPTATDTTPLDEPAARASSQPTIAGAADVSAITHDLFDSLESRLRRRERQRFFRNAVVGLLLLIVAGLAGYAAWLWTDTGDLIVQSYDPSAVVSVTRNGHRVDQFRVGDRPASTAYYTGDFRVEIEEAQTTGVAISQPEFSLRRGQVMIVEVQPPIERRVAIFVVSHKGHVVVKQVEESQIIATLSKLPAGRFKMNRIALAHGSGEKFLQAIDLISQLKQSPDIHLDGKVTVADDESLSQLAKLRTLQGLQITNGRITAAGIGKIATLPALNRLAFEDTPLNDDAMRSLATAKGLNTLSLEGCAVTSQGVKHLQQLPELKSLLVADNALSPEAIGHLAAFPALEELSLPGKTALTEEEVVSIAGIKKLRALNLSGSTVTDAAMPQIASIVTLEILDVSDTAVTDDGLIALQKSKLKELNVDDTKVTRAGVAWVQSMLPTAQLDSRFSPGGKPIGVAQAAMQMVEAKQRQAAYVRGNSLKPEYINSLNAAFRLIPPGDFQMGSPPELVNVINKALGNTEANNETPRRKVTITKPFYMGAHEITQQQYEQVMGSNPSIKKGDKNLSVGMIRWNDAVEFCNKLSKLEGRAECYKKEGVNYVADFTAAGYRLPTEAEWEYAARSGTDTAWYFGDSASEIDQYAWHKGNAGDEPPVVGGKLPNAFGLYDMYGSSLEWCNDVFESDYYADGDVFDPKGPAEGGNRVVRGGHFMHTVDVCRSGCRLPHKSWVTYPYGGFRVVLADTTPETP